MSRSRRFPTLVRPLAAAAMLLAWSMIAIACKPPARQAFAELEYPEPVAETRTVEVGAVTVAYTDQGPREASTTLVLIHGLGSYLPAWKDNVPALAQRYRVIAIDLPGYGKSSKSDDYAYSMAFFASVVEGVVETLGVEHPVLVGHSMGGQIALTHALRYPGRARALVLTSPAGLETFEDGEATWLADAVTEEFTCKATPEAIYARHVQNFHRMPKDAHFMVEHRVQVIGGPDFPQYCRAVSRSVRAMLDEPVYERLPEVAVPVLVLFGKHDQLIPNPFLHGGSTERLARRTVEQLPSAELVMLPRAGHMAQLEQAQAWNDAVLGFLGKLPAVPVKAAEAGDEGTDGEPTEPTEPTGPTGEDEAPDGEATDEATIDVATDPAVDPPSDDPAAPAPEAEAAPTPAPTPAPPRAIDPDDADPHQERRP